MGSKRYKNRHIFRFWAAVAIEKWSNVFKLPKKHFLSIRCKPLRVIFKLSLCEIRFYAYNLRIIFFHRHRRRKIILHRYALNHIEL